MVAPHRYVSCDVPEGMTLTAYRAARRTARRRPIARLLPPRRRRRTRR